MYYNGLYAYTAYHIYKLTFFFPDLYGLSEACWHSFVFHNPDLEGVWEDGELAGEIYVPNGAEDPATTSLEPLSRGPRDVDLFGITYCYTTVIVMVIKSDCYEVLLLLVLEVMELCRIRDA